MCVCVYAIQQACAQTHELCCSFFKCLHFFGTGFLSCVGKNLGGCILTIPYATQIYI